MSDRTNPYTEHSTEMGVADLIDHQWQATPHKVAVRCGDLQITYREFEFRAQAVASRLRQLGVGPDVPVGVGLRRSIDLAVAIYGVLKAGGAYVPLDPDLPRARRDAMIEQSQIPLLLTSQGRPGSVARLGHCGNDRRRPSARS